MKMGKSGLLAMLLLASPVGAAEAQSAPAGAAKCTGAPVDIARGVEIITAWRAFRGPDGVSRVEKVTLPGTTGTYIGGTVKLTQFDLGNPSKVVIVYGYPDIEIPPHPAPYREIFLILGGSSLMIMPDGQRLELTPGTMFIADDVGVTTGRGGRAGPCGYVALDLQFSAPPLPATVPGYDKK